MARVRVEAGLLVDENGDLLDPKHVVLRESSVSSWVIELLCPAKDRIHLNVFHLSFKIAKNEVDLDLYPKLAVLLEEMEKRVEGRRRFLRRLADGNFEPDWSVASGRAYNPEGKDFGGLWQSTGSQRQYFVHGVKGVGPCFSADECRKKVQEHARKILSEFDQLVEAGKIEAALKLAASL